jgi:hypothetical protein
MKGESDRMNAKKNSRMYVLLAQPESHILFLDAGNSNS